jgi:hypothetical protein
MTIKIPCIKCGVLILPSTAEKTGGSCMSCNNNIEQEIREQRRADNKIRISKIITSSTNVIIGYRIIRQISMVSIIDEIDKDIAEEKFLLAVEEAGGNGVINMQVRPHRGGYFSVQGDAVLIELG